MHCTCTVEKNYISQSLFFKVKLFLVTLYSTRHKRTTDRNLIVLLKNGKEASQSFNTEDTRVLTATLWF